MENVSALDLGPNISGLDEDIFSLGAGEILLGRIESIDGTGCPVVSVPQVPAFKQRSALTTVAISHQHLGSQVALTFTQGVDPQPIIMGLIYSPLKQVLDDVLANTVYSEPDQLVFAEPVTSLDNPSHKSMENAVYIDGKQLILEGHEEITLKCGEASITLNKSGKISIRGKYILSRATGVNRILGGAVQVN